MPRLPCRVSIAYRGIVQFKTFFPPVKKVRPPVENVYEAPVSVEKTTFSHWNRCIWASVILLPHASGLISKDRKIVFYVPTTH